MFMHVFGYRLKCLMRDKETVFWTLLFPLLLATMFHFAFGNLMGQQATLNPIKVAVIESDAYRENVAFRQVLEMLSEPGPNQLIELTIADDEKAHQLLEEGAIAGVIIGDPIGLTVTRSGINQSILKAILDEYVHTSATVTGILERNPAASRALLTGIGQRRSYTERISFSSAALDTELIYFYALIAMACLYTSFWGLRNTIDVQADLSPQGARRSLAPTHKLGVVLFDMAAALAITLTEVMILLAYLMLALRVDFGSQIGYVLLTCFAGCFAGVSFGVFVGTFFGKNANTKFGFLIGSGLTMSFLAGLMMANIKDVVARKAPFLAYINPAALITDAFYSLCMFDTHRRFFLNIGLLFLIASIMCISSFLRLRREKYASL